MFIVKIPKKSAMSTYLVFVVFFSYIAILPFFYNYLPSSNFINYIVTALIIPATLLYLKQYRYIIILFGAFFLAFINIIFSNQPSLLYSLYLIVFFIFIIVVLFCNARY